MQDPRDFTSDEILESYVRLNEIRWDGEEESIEEIELEEDIKDEYFDRE